MKLFIAGTGFLLLIDSIAFSQKQVIQIITWSMWLMWMKMRGILAG